MMDKKVLVEQLAERLRTAARTARRASQEAAQEAREGATPAERREDARVALEQGGLARGQERRAEQAAVSLAAIERFQPPSFAPNARIDLGAIVEIEDEEGGRTLFLAPVGAGEELTGPDGDGFLSVVTPSSPVGRALMGRREGETVEVTIGGDVRELSITFVG
ncbi:MAG: GreA/GreB family elongation factor [Deltaproteobacteria bacterium]|nr:GreA/GreB family elongation factor [Deltaproteobacteria bacterium]